MIFFIKLLSKLPLSFLYLIAFLLQFPARLIYRPKIVLKNLKLVFPEKTNKEINKIKNNFYHHFTQLAVEIIKSYTISERDFTKRVTYTNPEITHKYHKENLPILVYASHYCNWEWLALSSGIHLSTPMHIVYQQIMNPDVDKFFFDFRSKFNNKPVLNKKIAGELPFLQKQKCIIGLASDQAPAAEQKSVWSNFLGLETEFHKGIVSLPANFEAYAVFAKINRVKKGYYNIELVPMGKTSELDKYDILRQFIEQTASLIKENPANYLWTHNRWKHTREKTEELLIFPSQTN